MNMAIRKKNSQNSFNTHMHQSVVIVIALPPPPHPLPSSNKGKCIECWSRLGYVDGGGGLNALLTQIIVFVMTGRVIQGGLVIHTCYISQPGCIHRCVTVHQGF